MPANAVAVVGTETVPRAKLADAADAGLRAVQGRQEGLPEARHGRAQAAPAELRRAAREAGGVRRRGQAAQGHRQADRDQTNLQKLKLQYAKGTNGKVDDAKWQKVLTDNSTTQATVVDNLRNGLLRQAIYVNLTKNVTVPTPR